MPIMARDNKGRITAVAIEERFKMMEERLGRFGRPLTTLLIICLALGVIAWGINQFVTNAILPLARVFEGEPLLTKSRVGPIVVSVLIYTAVGVIANLLIRTRRR